MYSFIRSILFLFDAEKVHYFSMNKLKWLAGFRLFRWWLRKMYEPKDQPVSFAGLSFKNQVGLGAGFDKNALYLPELELLGFGHVEIGTVTPRPQAGNDKPRLFRLKKDKALLNRMGFNNDGADIIAKRLKEWRANQAKTSKGLPLMIGGNIGKQKTTPNAEAYLDYDICFRKLYDYVDYFVVNVSSPNTPGLRELQDKGSLRTILTNLQDIRKTLPVGKPILLKIAPDLTEDQLNDVVELSLDIALDGLIISNTTLDRTMMTDAGKIKSAEAGAGGLSGAPLRNKSTDMIAYVHKRSEGRLPIIGVGGIFTAADAREKIQAGASLVQVWTGFVYQGPSIARSITDGLSK